MDIDRAKLIDDFCAAAGNVPVIDRETAVKLSGGLIGSTKTLANLDSLKEGCSAQIRLGRRVGYQCRPFAIWLFNRMQEG